MAFGVTSTGFNKKDLDTIKSEIEASLKADISPALNLLATSVFGQLVGVFADKVREIWDVDEAVYNSQYPDTASGSALDNVAAITGAVRLPATKSTVTLDLTGTPGTLIPAGRQVSVVGTGDKFVTLIDVTLTGGSASVAAEALNTGPIVGSSGTITVIETPVAGWATVTNPLDADVGTDIETDAAFRLRRENLLAVSGAGTLEAIRAAVLSVTGVVQALVFENVTLTVDVNGLPGKSFEVVVQGGTDADIAQAIFDTKPAGIESFGTTTESVTDSQGFSHDIEFTRPTEIDIYIDVDVDVTAAEYAGDAAVETALVTEGDTMEVGEDVIYVRFQCVPLTVSGVVDVTDFKIDVTASPTGTSNIAIALRELARFDTSRITVVSTPI